MSFSVPSSSSSSSSSLVVRKEEPLSDSKKRKGEPLDREEGSKASRTGELSTPSSSSRVATVDLEAAKIEGLKQTTEWANSFFRPRSEVDPEPALVSSNLANFKADFWANDLILLEKALTEEFIRLQKGLAIFGKCGDEGQKDLFAKALVHIEIQLFRVQKALDKPEPEPLASESAAADLVYIETQPFRVQKALDKPEPLASESAAADPE